MSTVTTVLRHFAIAICLLDLSGRSASAYLDPGVGSQALQVGFAGLLGLAFTLRGRIQNLFSSLRRKK